MHGWKRACSVTMGPFLSFSLLLAQAWYMVGTNISGLKKKKRLHKYICKWELLSRRETHAKVAILSWLLRLAPTSFRIKENYERLFLSVSLQPAPVSFQSLHPSLHFKYFLWPSSWHECRFLQPVSQIFVHYYTWYRCLCGKEPL